MQLIIKETAQTVSECAFSILSETVNKKPECAIGYPTGGSVNLLYEMMRNACKKKELNMSQTHAFQLDDYLGLSLSHPARFANILYRQVFIPCGIDQNNVHLFGDNEAFSWTEAENYEKICLEHGGLDLQLLGVGANGHVGFNEPSEDFAWDTHRVELTTQMRMEVSKKIDSIASTPHYAVTLGIRAIYSAKKLLLLAMGEEKAEAIKKLVINPPSPSCPISALRQHSDFVVVIDRAAAKLLPEGVWQ